MFSILKISLSLYTISEDIVELDVLDFDKEKKPVVAKKKLLVEDFVSFCTGSRYITLIQIYIYIMQAVTINFQYFELDSSPGVRVVVNTFNITLTFLVNGCYKSK